MKLQQNAQIYLNIFIDAIKIKLIVRIKISVMFQNNATFTTENTDKNADHDNKRSSSF